MKEREQRWVEQIRTGDENAFEMMFRTYYPRLCRFAADCVHSESRARDLVQDVFLRIWERRTEWKVRDSLKAYLYQAVRNRALNHVRRRDATDEMKNGLQYTKEDVQPRTADDVLHAGILSQEVEKAISQLPERRRMAFLLHRRHGLTYKEIAQVMEIARKTVENQIGRALKSMREELDSVFSRELK